MFFEYIERDAIPTGIGDSTNGDANYPRGQPALVETMRGANDLSDLRFFSTFAATMKPNDAWRTLKGTQHDDDVLVLS